MSKAEATHYLSDRDMAARYRTKSRATIWRWIRTAGLPKPVQLSPGCTRWRLSDVEEWESKRPGAAS